METQDLDYKQAAAALDALFQAQGIKGTVGPWKFSKKSPFPTDSKENWPHFSYDITFAKATGADETRRFAELTMQWYAGASQKEENGGRNCSPPQTPKGDRRPKPGEVFGDLCRNALDARGQTFEEWCDSFGYDSDSRKAEKTYLLCQSCYTKLRQFVDYATMQQFADLYSML